MWTCPECKAVNHDGTSTCVACSATRSSMASDVVVADVVPDTEMQRRWESWAAQHRLEPVPISRLGEGGAGVPRRFSIGRLLLLVTFFAVVFGLLQWLLEITHSRPETSKYIFTAIALLIAGVGVAQPLLFHGRNPRLASILAGMIVAPVVFTATVLVANWSRLNADRVIEFVLRVGTVSLLFGPLLGYLAGCLIAAVFLNVKDDMKDNAKGASESKETTNAGEG